MSNQHESMIGIMKLYDLRREDKMREARTWFGTFQPESAEQIMQALMNPETSAKYRMVTSYWDMAASFVNHGAIDEAMFYDVGGEAMGVFAKIEPFLDELREIAKRPKMFANLESYVMRQEGAKEMLAGIREMMKRWAEAQTKKA